MNTTTAAQVDIYSTERAGLLERLCRIAGQTTWREPRDTDYVPPVDPMPVEHTMLTGISFAHRRIPSEDEFHRLIWKRDPTDIGPYVLDCLIYRRVVHGREIRVQLVRALRDMSKRLAKADEDHVWKAAMPIIRECATGVEADQPTDVPDKVWIPASSLGIRLLWASAGQTLRALAERLR
jgi:hypothetical protein